MALHAASPRRLSRTLDLSAVQIGRTRRRSDRAIDHFWRWWNGGGAQRATEAVEGGDERRVVPEITSLIEAIDPGLWWEFTRGREGHPHVLTVSATGAPELRGVARRWLSAAPDSDPSWEFRDVREAVDGHAMWFRDRRLGFDDGEVVVELGLSAARVTVHHPEFVGLDAEDRQLAATLLVDAVCGEYLVEMWVVDINADARAPGDEAHPLRVLPMLLRNLARDNTDEDGDPAWQILHGDTPVGPMVAMVRVPLVSLSAPEFDQHVAVEVGYTDIEECGLPGQGSLPQLRDLEDHLASRIRGSGECVGAESCNGRRLLHFYVDASTPAAEQLRAAVTGWDQGDIAINVSDDPGWHNVRHLRI